MRPSRSNMMDIQRLERDADGVPTGRIRARAPYHVMTAQAVVDANPELLPFVHVPQYVDVEWANNDPPRVELKFASKAERDARVGRFID